jgi:AcrR family transcriptional regulator
VSADNSTRFTRKGLATRERIVDATAGLMFERGVQNTSIDDVRAVCGVSGSQMSHYFDGKRDLTGRVIAKRRSDVTAFHTQPRLHGLDSLAALRAWADACIADVDRVYRRGGCIFGSLVGELIEGDAEMHAELAAGYDDWIELFRLGLCSMQRRGELIEAANPRHLAASLVIAHQGGAMMTFVTGDPEPLRANLNAAVDYVCSFAVAAPRRTRARRARD